jgi:purine-nucleoside phosphorylase
MPMSSSAAVYRTMEPLRRFQPEWGLVLGSGLGMVIEQMEQRGRLSFADAPEMPESRAPGHAGEFVWGEIDGRKVVAASGRVHLYEGCSAREVTAGIRLMAAVGVSAVILTNAAGTLNEANPPGSWMAIRDHLNLTGTSPLIGGPNFVDMTEVYSKRLRREFLSAATETGTRFAEGVYAGVIGPQYETPAEIQMLRRLGADAVGMSTVLEAIQARALGLEVAGFSCLTNWAAGMADEPLSHGEVLAEGKAAAAVFYEVLRRVLGGSAR